MKELEKNELMGIDGGGMAGPPVSTYMSPAEIKAAGDLYATVAGAVVGFVCGLFNL